MVELILALVGASLVAASIAANQPWLDRHFLPSFVINRAWYLRIEIGIRIVVACIGVTLALIARRRVARLVVDRRDQILPVAIAVTLACAAGEAVLQRRGLRPAEWLLPGEEPRRQPDAVLGWTLVPNRTGHLSIGGRTVDYAVNPLGYRARSTTETLDVSRPTIVFSGESIIFGEGLTFDESIPEQTGAMLGVRAANLGVNGFSTDQSFLRLRQELPRFQRPTAVVSIFMPILFGRNLDDDRPHLGPGLTWTPAARHARLVSLARLFVPYRSDETIARGIVLTRDVLRATADLARTRGAVPLLIVPQVGPEDPTETDLRLRVLDEGHVPYLPVPLDARWTVEPADRHPDARGARAIAAAIAATCASSKGCR